MCEFARIGQLIHGKSILGAGFIPYSAPNNNATFLILPMAAFMSPLDFRQSDSSSAFKARGAIHDMEHSNNIIKQFANQFQTPPPMTNEFVSPIPRQR